MQVEENKAEEPQYKKYFDELVPNPRSDASPAHVYTVEIHRAMMTEESFSVFKKYEASIHKKEDKSESSYSGFLCLNPLYDSRNPAEALSPSAPEQDELDKAREFKDEGVWPGYLGGFDMYHRLDGKLFAVGVLDFTPQVLSSVYFFYDPEYEALSPGVLGALREIEYTRRVREKYSEAFRYYYMGFYI